jgi:uncharacterized protein (DUF362 family)
MHTKPCIAVTYNEANESQSIIEGLNLINAQQQIKATDTVVITPNWVNAKKTNPGQATVVGPESLKTIIEWVKSQQPKRIVVAAGSAQKETGDVMKAVGYEQIIQASGVEFIDLNHGPFKTLKLSHYAPSKTNIHLLVSEMTVLISFTQLKQHEEATMSAATKNIALSWPPAEQHGFPKKDKGIHEDLHGFIRAMAEKIPANISIVSASPAMVGTGPTEGAAKQTGLMITGNDMIATDVVCASLLGFKPQAIGYLYQLIRGGFGIGEISEIDMKGILLVDAQKIFSQKVYGTDIAMKV